MESRIADFIKKQKVATICCVDEDGLPYCFSCFFAFSNDPCLLFFKTNNATHHAMIMRKNRTVAGTIMPDKLNVLAIKGIQFQGIVLPPDETNTIQASIIYHSKYPFALAMAGDVWKIELTNIKMTDNSRGFGKKLSWNKTEELSAIL